jgi:hypothetical protein
MADLTSAQLATLKAGILADSTAAAFPNTAQGNYDCAAYLNAGSSPAVMIWLPSVSVSVINNAIDWTAGANGFISLTVSKQNAYFALTQGGVMDATQANIRAGFQAIFPAAIVTAIQGVAQRNSTRFEAMFTTASVCSLFGRQVLPNEVNAALNS